MLLAAPQMSKVIEAHRHQRKTESAKEKSRVVKLIESEIIVQRQRQKEREGRDSQRQKEREGRDSQRQKERERRDRQRQKDRLKIKKRFEDDMFSTKHG